MDNTPRRGRRLIAHRPVGLILAVLAGCGARTGLMAPDVALPPDAERIDASADARPPTLPPIDPVCPGTCPFGAIVATFPPFVPLAPPDVPPSCANGFELGGANGGCGRSTYTLLSTRPGGARAITLDVDLATYLAPDGVVITGRDATGATYTLLQQCRLQTALVGGPSTQRPPDDTIRQFRLDVRAGTTRLDFDFGAVSTPMYIRVLGLCDFAVTPYAHAAFWRAVP